jgi:hypothetical protein
VQLDAGPSVSLAAFTPAAAIKPVTVATATPSLPSDTLSLVVIQASSSGTVKLTGSSVQYTPTATPSKLISFSFQIKEQLGGVTPTTTVITGGYPRKQCHRKQHGQH